MELDSSMTPLVLASASPRRREILTRLGLPFIVIPPQVDEKLITGQSPERTAERLARAKARAVASAFPRGTIIGCDTLVAVKNRILGKPESADDARAILSFLSGKKQRVISGLCIRRREEEIELSGISVTTLFTRPMSTAEIDAYVATGACFDKAGAYAIQEGGDRFVEKIEGSFDNVVGFPTELFESLLVEMTEKVKHARQLRG